MENVQVICGSLLIDDLLDLSRITRNKLELRKERVKLAAVVQSAAETSRPLIEAADHQFTVTLPLEPILLDADSVRLAQVFSNLLTNSAKYTKRGGHIRLSAERAEGAVVVRVRDNGIGIPADKLAHIFEMFAQVDLSLERTQGGLGIGLALAKRLVELHGGSIEAHSEGPGKGSECTVRLPVVEMPRAEEPQPPGIDETRRHVKLRILVVDDNQDSADSMGMMLRMMGHLVCTAYDGQAGVEAAEEFRPDVAILDIGMPKLNGYDAARRIRAHESGKNTVLVAMTGWGQEEDRRRSKEAGFAHHLVKPVDPESLMNVLYDLPERFGWHEP
jgi:CheY-like chemotaxis protein